MIGQLSLFEKDDKKDDRIKSLLKHLLRSGRNLQYYEVYLQQFVHLDPGAFLAVFKRLEDLVTLSGTLYTTLGEISSLKHLKTLPEGFDKLFRSNLSPEPLNDFRLKEAKSRLEDLKVRFRALAQGVVDGIDREFYTGEEVGEAVELSMKALILLAFIDEETIRLSDRLHDI